MEQKYNIKGIDKIISKVGKKKLAEYYQVDINADFENVIMEDFKEHGIPNGLEVAFYFSLTPEEFNIPYHRITSKHMTHNIGFISGNVTDIASKEEIVDNFLLDLDCLGIKHFETSVNDKNRHGGYKVSLYNCYDDFHFSRQNKDGSWSQKIGYTSTILKCSDPLDNLYYRYITTFEIVKPVVRKLI